MEDIGLLPGSTYSTAWNISGDGTTLVGWCDFSGNGHAFRWKQGEGMIDLGLFQGALSSDATDTSSDGSVVVGNVWSGTDVAYRWTEGTGKVSLGYLPGGNDSRAWVVSPDGNVVAGTSNSSNGYRVYRWTQATGMVDLGNLYGLGQANAWGMDASGNILAGECSGGPSGLTAFLWTPSLGMIGVKDYLTGQGLDMSSWDLTQASDVSADGSTIVGWGYHNGDFRAWRASGLQLPVPEPATGFVLAGLFVACLRRARRR